MDMLQKSLEFVESDKQNLDLATRTKLILVLFNIFDKQSRARYVIFLRFLKFMEKHQLVARVLSNLKEIDTISEQWKISEQERRDLYFTCADILDRHNEG